LRLANKDGVRVVPSGTGERAVCPGCGKEVLSKCGDVVVWHWSHRANRDCDPWYEPETVWHRGWKDRLASLERQEITIQDASGTFHRADVQDENGIVVELQHSPISGQVIADREEFYTANATGMVWLFDARDKRRRIQVPVPPAKSGHPIGEPLKYPLYTHHGEWLTDYHRLSWSYCPKWTKQVKCLTFIDLGRGLLVELIMSREDCLGVYRLWSHDQFVERVKKGGLLSILQGAQDFRDLLAYQVKAATETQKNRWKSWEERERQRQIERNEKERKRREQWRQERRVSFQERKKIDYPYAKAVIKAVALSLSK